MIETKIGITADKMGKTDNGSIELEKSFIQKHLVAGLKLGEKTNLGCPFCPQQGSLEVVYIEPITVPRLPGHEPHQFGHTYMFQCTTPDCNGKFHASLGLI
jgi:hypothetical protein